MEEWVKIIMVDGHQVLVNKDFDDDKGSYKVNFTVNVDGVKAEYGLAFNEEVERDKLFHDETRVEKIANNLLSNLIKAL